MKKVIARVSLFLFSVFIGIALSSFPAMATDVGGIIDADTTWNLTGSPYIVTGGILVNSGVTLTIEAGVEVRFDGFYSLTVQGTIRALGTQGNEILFTSNIIPQQRGDWDRIKLDNNVGSELGGVIIEYSTIGISTVQGSNITINDNVFRHIKYAALGPSGSDNLLINNNYIYDCSSNWFPDSCVTFNGYREVDDKSAIFTNNTIENGIIGIRIMYSYNITINNNNFIETSGNTVEEFQSWGGVTDARYNYWGPETTAEMDLKGAAANIDKIRDYYDDPELSRVDYAEWLDAPNPDAYPWMGQTPVNQSPVANAGADQAVYDTVTLDGSASYDPDGSIDLYEWKLEHRDDPTYDRTTSGVNPTITNLEPGFYDTYLTVTDNDGATSRDTSIVSAAGPNNYAQCEVDLAQAQADLGQCEAELDQCLNPPPTAAEGPGQTCKDGLDNDGDGDTDCDDTDCSKKKYCKNLL